VRIFIQNEAGSFVRNFFNEKTLEFKGMSRVSRQYPFPYGFVLNTTADDGLNVDCFVLTTTSLRTGQIVECDPVGLMEQFEDGNPDHNVLAVVPGEKWKLDEHTKQRLADFVSHVFDHVSGKSMIVGRFLGPKSASVYLAQRKD
jgi:inorganic pyrophosphatase